MFIEQSEKLKYVCYDIRGPALDVAQRLESEGHTLIKLNIGNPAPFGFEAPEEIVLDVIRNLSQSQGYCDSKGLFSARKAVVQYYQQQGLKNIDVQDVYIGNGVSELILMATQGLLNTGDELLLPAPDYPLWTAAVHLAGGQAVHYLCDEKSDWQPDLADIRAKITTKTRGVVLINPNNPTGAVYSKAFLLSIVELAREHQLVIFADEIYDKILYDGAEHISICTLCSDVPVITFNGLSKTYRVAGFRQGWMLVSGPKEKFKGYIKGLDILASMRLCANVPMQHAIQTALGGYQSIYELTAPAGRLYKQRELIWQRLNSMEGVSCVKPKAALYMFARLDPKIYPIEDDQDFILSLLEKEKLLLVQGSGFNWHKPNYLRFVFLPNQDILNEAMNRFERFLHYYRQQTSVGAKICALNTSVAKHA